MNNERAHIPEQANNSRLRRLFHSTGINKAVLLSLAAHAFTALSGVITIFLLTQEEQGYYFTFLALVSLQVVFQFGLNFTCMQSTSHLLDQVKWTNGQLTGPPTATERILDLFHINQRWHTVSFTLFILIVTPLGFYFFNQNSNLTWGWKAPWMLFVVTTAVQNIISPILYTLYGCGKVTAFSAAHLVGAVVGSVASWLLLSLGFSLYAIALKPIITTIILVIFILHQYKNFVIQLYKSSKKNLSVNWRKDLFPLQWRLGVGRTATLIGLSCLTPIAFKLLGPYEAGKLGFTLMIVTSLSNLALTWLNTRSPYFGSLVAKKDFTSLRRAYKVALLQSWIFLLLIYTITWAAVYSAAPLIPLLADRILSPAGVGLLFLGSLATHIFNSLLIYSRAHKKEPLLPIVILNAILIPTLSIWVSKYGSAENITLIYFGIQCFIITPLAILAFTRFCWINETQLGHHQVPQKRHADPK